MATINELVSGATSGINFGSIGGMITFLAFTLLFALIGGAIFYFIYQEVVFNKRITIYQNIAGRGPIPVGKDRAKVIKISDAGEEVLFLRKRKLYKGAYGKVIGKNHYAFHIGRDGYWRNCTFSDPEEGKNEIKIMPVDRDMRYAHEGIRKNVSLRFEKKSFWKENLPMILGFGAIIIILVFMWLIADKYFTIFSAADGTLESSKEVLKEVARLLGSLDNLKSGGTGLEGA